MNKSVEKIDQYLLQQMEQVWPVESIQGVTSILAVSGGSDSVALAKLVSNLKLSSNVYLAHFNHGLRGTQSDEDAAFVQELSRALGFEFIGGSTADLKSESHGGQGQESLARNARYEFLANAAKELGARFVATAHTLDDQAETLIHRFFRGTGIRGLQGISASRMLIPGVSLVRPLLGCRKRELESFLHLTKQEFRVDQSNQSDQYTRNRIRNELIPLAEKIFEKEIALSLNSLATLTQQAQSWIDETVEAMFEKKVKVENGIVSIRVDEELIAQPRFLINELTGLIWQNQDWPLQQMSRSKWDSISDLIFFEYNDEANTNKIMLPGQIVAERRAQAVAIWDANENRHSNSADGPTVHSD